MPNHDDPIDRTDPRRADSELDPRRGTPAWRAIGAPIAECNVCDAVLDEDQLATGKCPACDAQLLALEIDDVGDEDVDALIGLQEETGEDLGVYFGRPPEPIAGGAIDYEIRSRADWLAEPPTYIAYMRLPAADFFQHHAADAGVYGGAGATVAAERAYVRAIQRFHKYGRGWSDIAYSFVEFPSGRIYEGRGWGRTGGHTLGRNSTSHAVCGAGNYMTQVPTVAMLDGTRWLVAEGKRLGKIAPDAIPLGHRDVGSTACPGDKLYAQMAYIRTPYGGPTEGDELEANEKLQLARVDSFVNGVDKTLGPKVAGEKGSRLDAGQALGAAVTELLEEQETAKAERAEILAKLDALLARG